MLSGVLKLREAPRRESRYCCRLSGGMCTWFGVSECFRERRKEERNDVPKTAGRGLGTGAAALALWCYCCTVSTERQHDLVVRKPDSGSGVMTSVANATTDLSWDCG